MVRNGYAVAYRRYSKDYIKDEKYAKKNNFIYLDYFSAMVDDNDGLKVPDYTSEDDLVHPNKAGYLVMENLAEKAIDQALSR